MLDILRIGEMLSRPTEALRYAAVAEDALDGQPMSSGVERAIWFYRGRVLYHLGLFRYALDCYRRNIPEGEHGLGAPYQRTSPGRRWRTCCSGSRTSPTPRTNWAGSTRSCPTCSTPTNGFVADVLQYRATLSSISLVHDLPFSSAAKIPLDLSATEHFGAEALSISEAGGRAGGRFLGAHRARFRGRSARHTCRRAEQEYAAARHCLHDPKVRSSSKVQILLYEAGFERRRGNYAEAEDALSEAVHLGPRRPVATAPRPRVLEQLAELQRVRGRDDRAPPPRRSNALLRPRTRADPLQRLAHRVAPPAHLSQQRPRFRILFLPLQLHE